MRIAVCRRRLAVTKQLADDREAKGRARAERREAMAQIVKADALQARGLRDRRPRLFQIGSWRLLLVAGIMCGLSSMRGKFDRMDRAAVEK